MNGRWCIGNNNDVSLFISAFSSFFSLFLWLPTTAAAAAATFGSKFCGYVRFFASFLGFCQLVLFWVFHYMVARKKREAGNAHTNSHFMYAFWVFSRNLLIYFVCVLNEWIESVSECVCKKARAREGEAESRRNWHQCRAAQAFDSNPSLLMYLYLHTFILFPTFYFSFFFHRMCACVCWLLAENILSVRKVKYVRTFDAYIWWWIMGCNPRVEPQLPCSKMKQTHHVFFFPRNTIRTDSASRFCSRWQTHIHAHTNHQSNWFVWVNADLLYQKRTNIYIYTMIANVNEKWCNNQHHLNAGELPFFKNYAKHVSCNCEWQRQTINNH